MSGTLLDVGTATAPKRAPRREADFYPTPRWVTRALLRVLELPSWPGAIWLEPAIGDGAIVREVEHGNAQATRRWLGCDIRDVRGLPYVERADLWIGDFLDPVLLEALDATPDVIITNPPFSHAQAFAERALEVGEGRAHVVMLLRLAFLESRERAAFLAEHVPNVYPLARRPSFTGGGTDSAAYAWFHWPPGSQGRASGRLFPPIGAEGT